MTVDRNGNVVRYGRINKEMVLSWMKLAPEADGAFWALNLMKYREVADYGDGTSSNKSGREADDAYTPRESLAGIGAQIVFAADVERTVVGDGTAWDRIGIVRYPSRRAFFEMQQREDFKKSHVHKDAGMEFTIVMSCLPIEPFAGSTDRRPYVELTVTADQEGSSSGGEAGLFDVEGVIVGDDRVWNCVAFRWLDAAPAHDTTVTDDSATYKMVLRPSIDRLATSVLDQEST